MIINTGLNPFYAIILFLLLNSGVSSQNNPFIYVNDGKFMYQCNELYPEAVNYRVDIKYDSVSDDFYISPESQYCPWITEYNCFDCGNPDNCIEKIHNDMEGIYNMGFNTVRVCGFTVKQSEDYENIASEYTDPLQSPYTTHFDLIEQFTDIASEHSLKVILLTAGHKVDGVKLKYGSYLEELAQRFKYNHTIFAYDIYNEPSVARHHTSSTPDNKNYVFDMFSNWYDNIRNNTANQLVTVGAFSEDAIVQWDPAVMKVDFMSFHTYPRSRVQT
jgi:hypothetical protein